jgi:hypothetical protein
MGHSAGRELGNPNIEARNPKQIQKTETPMTEISSGVTPTRGKASNQKLESINY